MTGTDQHGILDQRVEYALHHMRASMTARVDPRIVR
jgi:hypothetical protein